MLRFVLFHGSFPFSLAGLALTRLFFFAALDSGMELALKWNRMLH